VDDGATYVMTEPFAVCPPVCTASGAFVCKANVGHSLRMSWSKSKHGDSLVAVEAALPGGAHQSGVVGAKRREGLALLLGVVRYLPGCSPVSRARPRCRYRAVPNQSRSSTVSSQLGCRRAQKVMVKPQAGLEHLG
jgi:hypothetical protein